MSRVRLGKTIVPDLFGDKAVVHTFEPSAEAAEEFIRETENFTKHLTDDQIRSLRIYIENNDWVLKMKSNSVNFIDFGDDIEKLTPSAFYNMEKGTIYK